MPVSQTPCWKWTDVTLADEDFNSILYEIDSRKLCETQIEKCKVGDYDADTLLGSYPHRKYMVCMVRNIILWKWEDVSRMRDDERTNSEDRATQPMEAGGWVSQYYMKVTPPIIAIKGRDILWWALRDFGTAPSQLYLFGILYCGSSHIIPKLRLEGTFKLGMAMQMRNDARIFANMRE